MEMVNFPIRPFEITTLLKTLSKKRLQYWSTDKNYYKFIDKKSILKSIKSPRLGWELFYKMLKKIKRVYLIEQVRCEQVSHVAMPPMNKSTFYTWHCMINVESLAARTSIWEVHVLQCPAVPKSERIVEFPFVQVEVLWLNGNVVNQLKVQFIFAR